MYSIAKLTRIWNFAEAKEKKKNMNPIVSYSPTNGQESLWYLGRVIVHNLHSRFFGQVVHVVKKKRVPLVKRHEALIKIVCVPLVSGGVPQPVESLERQYLGVQIPTAMRMQRCQTETIFFVDWNVCRVMDACSWCWRLTTRLLQRRIPEPFVRIKMEEDYVGVNFCKSSDVYAWVHFRWSERYCNKPATTKMHLN